MVAQWVSALAYYFIQNYISTSYDICLCVVEFHFITQCKRLQTTQNKNLLRLLTNSDGYITIAELHCKAKMSMMRPFIMESSQKFLGDKARQSTMTADITNVRIHDNPTHTHKLIHQKLPIYLQRR